MLYFVIQKVMKQLRQHIIVGCNIAHLVEQFHVKESAVGSNPTIDKNAKSASVCCESHLMLRASAN